MQSFANEIVQKIATHADPRVRELASGTPDLSIIGRLLEHYIDPGEDFDPRYLTPGRSGSKVLLITFLNRLSRVVKFGEEAEIRREVANYEKTGVEDKIPQPTRSRLILPVHVADRYASLAYEWAGGWNDAPTLRRVFQTLDDKTLVSTIYDLVKNLERWHDVKESPGLPFDQWTWQDQAVHAIKDVLDSHRSSDPTTAEPLLQALQSQAQWRDSLRAKRSSAGICHGDMNCDNILVVATSSGHFATIIDFANVCTGQSPARDWAQLERDLKFRCLFGAFKNPNECDVFLQQIDDALESPNDPIEIDPRVTKVYRAIWHLRDRCRRILGRRSDIPTVEYAYFLLCWELAYLASKEYHEKHKEFTSTIVRAAYRSYLEVVREVAMAEAPLEIKSFRDLPVIERRHRDE